jgi:hypothetical protein
VGQQPKKLTVVFKKLAGQQRKKLSVGQKGGKEVNILQKISGKQHLRFTLPWGQKSYRGVKQKTYR